MMTPKNKRLSEANRDTITRFARKQIEATADSEALDAAYERAADAIHAAVVKINPPKDMAVLDRYGVAHRDACIYISTGGYNYERFTYRDGDKRIVLRPYRDCGRQPMLLEGEAEAAHDAYRASLAEYEKQLAIRKKDFEALIWGSTNFNSLAEAWPAVEALREQIVGTASALAVLSSEVTDRLKSDPAFTASVAA